MLYRARWLKYQSLEALFDTAYLIVKQILTLLIWLVEPKIRIGEIVKKMHLKHFRISYYKVILNMMLM